MSEEIVTGGLLGESNIVPVQQSPLLYNEVATIEDDPLLLETVAQSSRIGRDDQSY